MTHTLDLYYRLYDGNAPLASKRPLYSNHRNVSSIDGSDIPPPYTVENVTRFILEREAQPNAYPTAEVYVDRRDIRPAAAGTIIDIEQGPNTRPVDALRLVLRPDSRRSPSACATTAPTKAQIMALFPHPGPALTLETPVRWPGVCTASTTAVREYLVMDYERHHGYAPFFSSMFDDPLSCKCRFFNCKGFHNHTPFHLLTEYTLGAGPPHLAAIWQQHVNLERKQFKSDQPITRGNFNEHLGNEKYYQAYLHFFSDVVLRKPVDAVLEEWIFAPKMNIEASIKGGEQPEMLNRLLAGVMHPLIYVGFGLDFRCVNLLGLIVEILTVRLAASRVLWLKVCMPLLIQRGRINKPPTGLAQAAVHKSGSSALLPRHLFNTSSIPHTGAGTPAFSIAARILRDPKFANANLNLPFDEVHAQFGADVQKYAAEWMVNGVDPEEVKVKVRELTFLNIMIYTVGGWREGEGFRQAEFTLMHLVTSSITLPSYMAVLSNPSSKSLLLRAYFSRSLTYWISRGRPPLDLRSFFSTSVVPTIPGNATHPYTSAFPGPASPGALTPNPWLQIIQSALVHPDDHLCKLQRALAHYASLYGDVPAGTFKGTELDGSELVDGSFFVRSAGLTMERMGRVREGEKDRFWSGDPNHPDS
ncbi:hypothetical protein DFH06DRAFT_448477 [Mycena polygramma]|nr:hypothetical protein DFH06DRAFT_448477 [Mycena polygramma]